MANWLAHRLAHGPWPIGQRAVSPLRVRLLWGLGIGLLGAAAILLGTLAAANGMGLGLALGVSFAAAGAGFLTLSALCVGRPLHDTERSAATLARGELQRPVVLSATATAEIHELQLAWEEMRRALITKLRSSTELNLQLESEVARRSAELSSRNTELSEALERLRTTRDELVRTEKLAAVGRIAASVTAAISTPVSGLTTTVATLTSKFTELERLWAEPPHGHPPPAAPPDLKNDLAAMDELIDQLLRRSLRVRDIIRAMRVYARPQGQGQLDLGQNRPSPSSQSASHDVSLTAAPEVVLDDVLRLVADPNDSGS